MHAFQVVSSLQVFQSSFCLNSHLLMRSTFPIHLILLDLITPLMFGAMYKLCPSLCSLLHPPTTSSLLGPNILLSTLFQTPSVCVLPLV
jgi:hypothetical protein